MTSSQANAFSSTKVFLNNSFSWGGHVYARDGWVSLTIIAKTKRIRYEILLDYFHNQSFFMMACIYKHNFYCIASENGDGTKPMLKFYMRKNTEDVPSMLAL